MTRRRKPLAFNTTMRNPGRMANFVSILSDYENQILTSDLIFRIEAQFIRQKIYMPTKRVLGTYVPKKKEYMAEDQSDKAAEKVSDYYEEWSNSDPIKNPISLDKVIYLLKNTITSHKEAGYDFGWESRFQTHISFCNELGFTFIEKDKPVLISDTGKLLISQYKDGHPIENYDSDPEHTAFLNALAKYQTNNPWRKNTISVNFLYLFLSTVKYLDDKFNSKGISRKELPFFIVWPDNNYKQLAKFINKFREVEGRKPSPEVVYDYAMNILDENSSVKFGKATDIFKKQKSKDYKIEKLIRETPDDVMRKLRQSQTVSLRGAGYYLDINHFEDDKVEQIVTKYGINHEFNNDFLKYFQYMGSIDIKLEFNSDNVSEERKKQISDVRLQVVNDWAEKYSWDQLSKEIDIASRNRGESKDVILREIDKPTRLEFLASIIMKKSLKDARVIPHYKVDDAGIPYDTASGGSKKSIGTDIDIIENHVHALLEPTVAESRSFQVEHEIPSITHHIKQTLKQERNDGNEHKNHFAIFLAGRINGDVGFEVAVRKELSKGKVSIYPWETHDYVEKAKVAEKLTDYAIIRPYARMQSL